LQYKNLLESILIKPKHIIFIRQKQILV